MLVSCNVHSLWRWRRQGLWILFFVVVGAIKCQMPSDGYGDAVGNSNCFKLGWGSSSPLMDQLHPPAQCWWNLFGSLTCYFYSITLRLFKKLKLTYCLPLQHRWHAARDWVVELHKECSPTTWPRSKRECFFAFAIRKSWLCYYLTQNVNDPHFLHVSFLKACGLKLLISCKTVSFSFRVVLNKFLATFFLSHSRFFFFHIF